MLATVSYHQDSTRALYPYEVSLFCALTKKPSSSAVITEIGNRTRAKRGIECSLPVLTHTDRGGAHHTT